MTLNVHLICTRLWTFRQLLISLIEAAICGANAYESLLETDTRLEEIKPGFLK